MSKRKMRRRAVWVSAAAAMMLMFGVATVVAQNQSSRQDGQEASTNYVRVSDLLGGSAYSENGDEIGDVENVVFDSRRQRVLYVVVAEGGFLGIGDDLHAIPWSWVVPRQRDEGIVLPIDEEMLDEADGFGKYPTNGVDRQVGDWPDNPPTVAEWSRMEFNDDDDLDWFDRNDIFESRKATELIGMNVEATGTEWSAYSYDYDESIYDYDGFYDDEFGLYDGYGYYDDYGYVDDYYYGENDLAGEIDDLLVSEDGRLEFVTVSADNDFLGVGGDDVIAMPWARVTVYPEAEVAVADFSQYEARQLLISEDEIERLEDPRFRENLYGIVGVDYVVWVGDADSPQRGDNRRFSDNRSDSRGDGDMNGRSNGKMRDDRSRRSDMRDERAGQGRSGEKLQRWSQFLDQCFDRNQRQSDRQLSGTVERVGTFRTRPNADAPSGRSFVMSTRNDDHVTVYVGPHMALPQQFELKRDSRVTVEGAECRLENQTVFVATRIETDGQTFSLTERDGRPQWESTSGQYGQRQRSSRQEQGFGERTQRSPQDEMKQWSQFATQCLGSRLQSGREVTGEVRNVGTFYTDKNANVPDGERLVITTDRGERIKVYTGPEDSEVTNRLRISPGDQVTIHGSECRIGDEQVFVANRIETEDVTFELAERNGVPHWTKAD